MSNLLGIFVLGHYGALYTQNDENGVIFFAPRTPTREGPKRCGGPDVRLEKIYKNKAKPSLLQTVQQTIH